MITLANWLKANNYKIKESAKYQWDCYGNNAAIINCYPNEDDINKLPYDSEIIFDTVSGVVYEVSICDYDNKTAYRLINPDYVKSFNDEVKRRSQDDLTIDYSAAWDDVSYTNIETDNDFMEKLVAICNGKEYDKRVEVPLDLNKDELFTIMLAAHKKDITLNQFIIESLQEFINRKCFNCDINNESET
jgi:hypothetical protein